MKKSYYIATVVVIVLFLIILGWAIFSAEEANPLENKSSPVENTNVSTNLVSTPEVVDYNKYSYELVDENVKNILSSMIQGQKTAFYLPPTGYINVSGGTKFGVAYALNNPNPSGENRFEFNWTVDDSVINSCEVSVEEAQGWIEHGRRSWGKIPEGWIDHMTIYFSFPSDISCNVKYNFMAWKDGEFYDSKILEFNII